MKGDAKKIIVLRRYMCIKVTIWKIKILLKCSEISPNSYTQTFFLIVLKNILFRFFLMLMGFVCLFVFWLFEGKISLVCCSLPWLASQVFLFNSNVKFKWKTWWIFLVVSPDLPSLLLYFALCQGGWSLRSVLTSFLALWLLGDLTNGRNQLGKPHRRRERLCLFPSILLAGCGWTGALFLYLRTFLLEVKVLVTQSC